jgi:hypothetical protein
MRAARVLAIAGITGSILWASSAGAATISVGLQEAGFGSPLGSITNEGIGFNGAYGTFSANIVSALPGIFPDLLNSNTLNTSSATPGTLSVYVTIQGLTTPISSVLSSLTTNLLPAGWSVTEQTFLDTGNGLFTTSGGSVTMLSSHTFTNPPTAGPDTSKVNAAISSGSMYSITELYVITSSGLGGPANNTIDVVATTPLPGALPLLGSGLIGLWAWGRKRKPRAGSQLAMG